MQAYPDHPLPYALPASVPGHHQHPSRSCSSILSLRGSHFRLRYALTLGTSPRSNLDLLSSLCSLAEPLQRTCLRKAQGDESPMNIGGSSLEAVMNSIRNSLGMRET